MKISLSAVVFIDRTLATLNYCSILPFGFLGFFSYYRSKTDLSGVRYANDHHGFM